APRDVQLSQQLVAALWRGATGKDEGLSAAPQRVGDLGRGRLGDLLGRREDRELRQLHLPHKLEGSKQRAVEDLVVSACREEVQQQGCLILVLDLLDVPE